jgi:general stress protein YciG
MKRTVPAYNLHYLAKWLSVQRLSWVSLTSFSSREGSIMDQKTRRGFAAMDQEKQRTIASKGGRAAHQKGTAHQFTSDEARAAGRKGGEAVSRNRMHMSAIGRKGGEAVSRDRAHMSRIGREAGQAARANRKAQEMPAQESLSTSEEQAATARHLGDGQGESSFVGDGPAG